MERNVIEVVKLSKVYRLGEIGSGSLSEDIKLLYSKILGKVKPLNNAEPDSRLIGNKFLALSDINFNVTKGEIVGIIGNNGAGKSTLLKIISQISSPTEGEIRIKGRVASLLEVGTGFHPELTGRENIFLNGAILGMTKFEISSKLMDIINFSGISTHIDTPVKRYSSGMKVRLGFAVAAHLEPEILIVDEVLAVGDAEFQTKCIGKMKDVAGLGRTILFVSHNLSAVRNLCTRAIVLKDGRMKFDGGVEEAISIYMQNSNKKSLSFKREFQKNKENFHAVILSARIEPNLKDVEHIEDSKVYIEMEAFKEIPNFAVGISLRDINNNYIFMSTSDEFENLEIKSLPVGIHSFVATIPGKILKPGLYHLDISLRGEQVKPIDKVLGCLSFSVIDSFTNRGRKGMFRKSAIVSPLIEWKRL